MTCACAHVWAVAWWLLVDAVDVVRVSSLVRGVRKAENPLAMRVPRLFMRAFWVIFALILALQYRPRSAWH